MMTSFVVLVRRSDLLMLDFQSFISNLDAVGKKAVRGSQRRINNARRRQRTHRKPIELFNCKSCSIGAVIRDETKPSTSTCILFHHYPDTEQISVRAKKLVHVQIGEMIWYMKNEQISAIWTFVRGSSLNWRTRRRGRIVLPTIRRHMRRVVARSAPQPRVWSHGWCGTGLQRATSCVIQVWRWCSVTPRLIEQRRCTRSTCASHRIGLIRSAIIAGILLWLMLRLALLLLDCGRGQNCFFKRIRSASSIRRPRRHPGNIRDRDTLSTDLWGIVLVTRLWISGNAVRITLEP